MEALTKDQAVKGYEILRPEEIIIELDEVDDKVSGLWKPTRLAEKQQQSCESGRIIKMYEPETGVEKEEMEQEYPLFRKLNIGDRLSFHNYVSTVEVFPKFPLIRKMSLDEVGGRLHFEEGIMD